MNWGFIGFGKIAKKFYASLEHVPGSKLVAIASRSSFEDAAKLCPESRVYQDYEDLVKDPDVEVVYINTTHNFHFEQVMLCLKHGKHVLCEKPMALTTNEARRITEAKGSLFVMEAMWMKFLPAYRKMMEIVQSGGIGSIQLIKADFAFMSPLGPSGRLLNPALAGGAMYDLGIYPLTLSLDLMDYKEPVSYKVNKRMADTGVEDSIAFQLDYHGGVTAQLYASFRHTLPCEAIILGDKGRIHLPMFWKGQELTWITDEQQEVIDCPFEYTGYYHEIIEVEACIHAQKAESSIMTLQHSMMTSSLMEAMLNS